MFERRFTRAAWRSVFFGVASTSWLVSACGGAVASAGTGGSSTVAIGSGAGDGSSASYQSFYPVGTGSSAGSTGSMWNGTATWNGVPGGTTSPSTSYVGTPDAGTLVVQAFGGAAGEVAAQASVVESGVGLQEKCGAHFAAGECQMTSCESGGGIGSPAPGFGNVGTIVASAGSTTELLSYNGFGYSTVDFPATFALGTAGVMTFQGGDGTTVPKFAVSATIPGPGVMTSPVPTVDGGTVTIDTSQDLSVAWLPIAIGQIHFTLHQYPPVQSGATTVTIACTFNGSAGTGVVAQSFLSSLKAMSGTNPTYAYLNSENEVWSAIPGLIVDTQSYQTSASTVPEFEVVLQ